MRSEPSPRFCEYCGTSQLSRQGGVRAMPVAAAGALADDAAVGCAGARLLTCDQAATLLNVKPSWIYERTRQPGAIPHRRLGRQVRFLESELLEWVDAGCPSKNCRPRGAVPEQHARRSDARV